MSESEMKSSGRLASSLTLSDKELLFAIRGAKLALAYLEGRGSEWALASGRLRRDLDELYGFASRRNLTCPE